MAMEAAADKDSGSLHHRYRPMGPVSQMVSGPVHAVDDPAVCRVQERQHFQDVPQMGPL